MPVAALLSVFALGACSDMTAPEAELSDVLAPSLAIADIFYGMELIAPPASLAQGTLGSDEVMRIFPEQEGFTLTADVVVDAAGPGGFSYGNLAPAVIPAGTVVNSYLIHVDRHTTGILNGRIEFEEEILGLIGSWDLLHVTDGLLGVPGLNYSIGAARSFFEASTDVATVTSDLHHLKVRAFVFGNLVDHIRVLTVGAPLDTDGDGVPDSEDAFPNSNLDATVSVGACDSGVGNQLQANGATFNDLLGAAADGARNHGQFVSAVSRLADGWKKDGLISGRDKGAITSCAAGSK